MYFDIKITNGETEQILSVWGENREDAINNLQLNPNWSVKSENMIVKSGRNEFEITKADLFLDNGSCIQLVTQKTGRGWDLSYPIIAKINWKKYLPFMELVKSEKQEKFELKYYKLK